MDSPRTDTHIPFLDHIRGFAILIVFVFHCYMATKGFVSPKWNGMFLDFSSMDWASLLVYPSAYGGFGVPIFFVVSGFCIHLSHSRTRNKSIGNFFIRRFFRIYPPYLVALLIFCFVFPWQALKLDSFYSLAQLGTHLLLVHNLWDRSFYSINASFWSIAVEFQLYIIYPLLFSMVRKLSWIRTLWVLSIIEIVIRLVMGYLDAFHGMALPKWIEASPFSYWFSWSIGAAAAEAFLHNRKLPFHRVPVWLFPLLTVVCTMIRPLSPLSFIFASLTTVSVISSLLGKGSDSKALVPHRSLNHLSMVGVWSYSIYLLHQPIIILVPKYIESMFPTWHPHPLVMFGLCCATWLPVLLVSWLFYRYVELPSIEMGKAAVKWNSPKV